MTDALHLIPAVAGLPVIASVSGGKDSTALILALREAEIPARHVFADTGWEAPETYAYLDLLRARLGIVIDVVRGKRDMVDHIMSEARFPAGAQKWCTRDLKIRPLQKYHREHGSAGDGDGLRTVSALGIRAEESAKRAGMLPWEYDHRWGGYIWRPLLAWTIADVISIHHRHSIPINPLYQRGFDRVGCYPCIFAAKHEIKLLADTDPARIDLIARLERQVITERQRRNEERPGRYKSEQASFFGAEAQGLDNVSDVVEWARTVRGGRQFPLFDAPPAGGCMRWGICEHTEAA